MATPFGGFDDPELHDQTREDRDQRARQPVAAVREQDGNRVRDRGGEVPKPANVVGHGRAVYGRVMRWGPVLRRRRPNPVDAADATGCRTSNT